MQKKVNYLLTACIIKAVQRPNRRASKGMEDEGGGGVYICLTSTVAVTDHYVCVSYTQTMTMTFR